MTYQEAIEEKEKHPSSALNVSGLDSTFHVAPKLHSDFKKWNQDFDRNTFTDETAKQYSSNNEFFVYSKAIRN